MKASEGWALKAIVREEGEVSGVSAGRRYLQQYLISSPIWYRRSADTCGSCSSSPNSIVWYRLPADTRVISSEAGLQTLWYRRAADTSQYRGNVFRDLHLYRRMQVLCRRIQTCPPFVCFLFRRIGVCYRRLVSV